MTAARKQKVCRVCDGQFWPLQPLQRVCSPVCALQFAKAARTKAERKEYAAKKALLKARSQWMRKVQGITEMKKAEAEHLSKVAALGCIACRNQGYPDTPAEIHHIRTGQGKKRASHFEVIGLCPAHHRTGGFGIAIHAGQKTWENAYGSELELLAQVRRELGIEVAA